MSVLTLLPLSWLTEEQPDKHRRRRICLGCGESFEYPVKSVPAVSFVSWIKMHLPCGEFYSPSIDSHGAAADSHGAAAMAEPKAAELPECLQCGFAGADLTPSGFCAECQGVNHLQNEGRITAFMERTGCTREEVQRMIDKGLITLRGLRDSAPSPGSKCSRCRPAVFAEPVPALNPAGDPCTFTTKPGPLLRRGDVKQVRTKKNATTKKPELMRT